MEHVYSPGLCEEKHRHLDEQVNKNTEQIVMLTRSDAIHTANISLLLKAVWGMFGTVAIIGVSFLIWYIQNL